MKDFNYCAPTRVIFGKNTELEVGKALKNAGATRVLMQYGSATRASNCSNWAVCSPIRT